MTPPPRSPGHVHSYRGGRGGRGGGGGGAGMGMDQMFRCVPANVSMCVQ